MSAVKTMFSDEELYEELKNLPDFKHLPLPNHWYQKFNIPAPRPVSFQTFAMERRWLKHKFDDNVQYEVRNEPVPGGVRPVLEEEVIPVIVETSSETPQQTLEEKGDSTTPSDSEPQQLEAGPSVPSSDDE
jgi:hypothetical protein